MFSESLRREVRFWRAPDPDDELMNSFSSKENGLGTVGGNYVFRLVKNFHFLFTSLGRGDGVFGLKFTFLPYRLFVVLTARSRWVEKKNEKKEIYREPAKQANQVECGRANKIFRCHFGVSAR